MASPPADIKAELDSKSSTIESMEIEISKLKARVERQESGADIEKEQVAALEDKVARAEAAAGKAQRELQDLKRNLDRTAEKAVREGSERSSAETKVKTLEHELEQAQSAKDELSKKADGLEKKVATLTTLHKEQDARLQALRKEKEGAEKEVKELRLKVEKLESENLKLRSRKSTDGGGGLDDEGVDELENEERLKLEKKIRSLETEVHELRSGAWIERRREMESSGAPFQDVDLSGNNYTYGQRKSSMGPPGSGGIGNFITSGLNALAGGNVVGDDEFLEDDDVDFDEDAFRKAQEDESKRRLERIKEIKRALKHWEGWRLDIVDVRRGAGAGFGEIFEV
jgi:myosin heavy subunit